MEYTKEDYQKAIEFALNYPSNIIRWHYSYGSDIYGVIVADIGYQTVKLEGQFVRSCLKWKGIKKWRRD